MYGRKEKEKEGKINVLISIATVANHQNLGEQSKMNQKSWVPSRGTRERIHSLAFSSFQRMPRVLSLQPYPPSSSQQYSILKSNSGPLASLLQGLGLQVASRIISLQILNLRTSTKLLSPAKDRGSGDRCQHHESEGRLFCLSQGRLEG